MQWVSNNKNAKKSGITATKPSQKKQRDNRVRARGIRYNSPQSPCRLNSLFTLVPRAC